MNVLHHIVEANTMLWVFNLPFLDLGIVTRVRDLAVPKLAVHALDDETVPVYEPEALVRLRLGQAAQDHEAVLDLVGDAHAC